MAESGKRQRLDMGGAPAASAAVATYGMSDGYTDRPPPGHRCIYCTEEVYCEQCGETAAMGYDVSLSACTHEPSKGGKGKAPYGSQGQTAPAAAPAAATKLPATEKGITARDSIRADRPPHMDLDANEGIRRRIRVDSFPTRPPPPGRKWVFKGLQYAHPWVDLMYGHEAVEGRGAGSAAPAHTPMTGLMLGFLEGIYRQQEQQQQQELQQPATPATTTAAPPATTPPPDSDSCIEVYEDDDI